VLLAAIAQVGGEVEAPARQVITPSASSPAVRSSAKARAASACPDLAERPDKRTDEIMPHSAISMPSAEELPGSLE